MTCAQSQKTIKKELERGRKSKTVPLMNRASKCYTSSTTARDRLSQQDKSKSWDENVASLATQGAFPVVRSQPAAQCCLVAMDRPHSSANHALQERQKKAGVTGVRDVRQERCSIRDQGWSWALTDQDVVTLQRDTRIQNTRWKPVPCVRVGSLYVENVPARRMTREDVVDAVSHILRAAQFVDSLPPRPGKNVGLTVSSLTG